MTDWFLTLIFILPSGEFVEEIPSQKRMTDQQCVEMGLVETKDRPTATFWCLPREGLDREGAAVGGIVGAMSRGALPASSVER